MQIALSCTLGGHGMGFGPCKLDFMNCVLFSLILSQFCFGPLRLLSLLKLCQFPIDLSLSLLERSYVKISMKIHSYCWWVRHKKNQSVPGFFSLFCFIFASFLKLENSVLCLWWQTPSAPRGSSIPEPVLFSSLATREHWAPRPALGLRCLAELIWRLHSAFLLSHHFLTQNCLFFFWATHNWRLAYLQCEC